MKSLSENPLENERVTKKHRDKFVWATKMYTRISEKDLI